MKNFYFLIIFVGLHVQSFSQSSDILNVTKRNGKYLKSFFAGSSIKFRTKNGRYVNGVVEKIKKDSLFITTYVMGRMMTNYGFTVIDTVSSVIDGISYKEITHIKIDRKKNNLIMPLSILSTLGGAGYVVLNIVNKTSNKESLTTNKNLKSLGIAIAAIGFGQLLNKFFIGTEYTRVNVNYINMQTVK